jgi:ribosomal protein S18 acetylase RimI-like enzyme
MDNTYVAGETPDGNYLAGETPDGTFLAGKTPDSSEASRIRPYQPDDLDALYDICLRTSDHGQDGSSLLTDPALPGHVYAAPYGLFEPSLAFILEDADGAGGYVIGALDSLAFAERLERDWWPALRRRYPDPPPEAPGVPRTADQRFAYQIHHPWPTAPELAEDYPSHLHINLLPRMQGRGHGRRLIDTLTGALRSRGSRGVHLHVGPSNKHAPGFYRRIGFTGRPAGDGHVFFLTLRS